MAKPTIQELWNLPAEKFNQWRRENDLLRLFQNFKKGLPHFSESMEEHDFSLDFLLESNNPGQYFHGDRSKLIVIIEKEDEKRNFLFIEPKSNRAANQVIKNSKKDENTVIEYMPYIKWGQLNENNKKFIPTKFSGKLEDLTYILGTAPDVPEGCNWSISGGGNVLKLGNTTLEDGHLLTGRNLDFTNLDFLKIEGGNHNNQKLNVFYAHCNNITLNQCRLTFLNFYSCDFAKVEVTNNSELYQFMFVGGNIWGLNSINSKLRYITFWKTAFTRFDLQNTFIEEIEYIPNTEIIYSGKVQERINIADNFKRFRIAYTKQGDRINIKESYYQERKYEMLARIFSISTFRKYAFLKSFKYFFVSLGLLFQDTVRCIKYVAKSTFEVGNYLLWGFGERPNRLFINALIIISAYTLLYFNLGVTKNISESIYMSIFSFVRFSANDLSQLSDGKKLLIASELVIGWIMIVLIINSYASKTKY